MKMKISLYASILALLVCGNGLVAMEKETAIQPTPYTWQYAKKTFKFKCIDSTSDQDIIEVPGVLVYYAKSLRNMINDLNPSATENIIIPLFNITKASFNRIIQALKIMVDPQKTYQDLITYFKSLEQNQLLECILHINFLDIQPLLTPATEVFQNFLVQPSSDILTWKKGLPAEILNLLKTAAVNSLNNPLDLCVFSQKPVFTESFSSIAATDDGSTANGQWDNTIILMYPNQQPTILEGHTGIVDQLEFSPNSQKLASACQEDNTVRLWDVATQQEIAQFTNSGQPHIQFSADSNYFACISSDRLIDKPDEQVIRAIEPEQFVLINRKTGQIHVLRGVRGIIYDIAISPDGKLVALAGEYVYLWNTQTQQLTTLNIGITPNSVMKATFSPDNTLLACCGAQTELGTVEIIFWNMITMKAHEPLPKIITGSIPSNIIFSPDSTLIAFDDGQDVQIIDIQKEDPIARITDHIQYVHSIDFTPDNKYLVSTAHDNIIRIFDIQNKKERKLIGKPSQVIDNADMLDNKTLMSIPEQGPLYMWDLVTGQSKQLPILPDTWGVSALSLDKTLLAIATTNGIVNLFHLKTGKMSILTTHSYELINLQFSINGKFLIATETNGTALLWDTQTGVSQKIRGSKDKIITDAYCIGDGTFVLAKEKTKNYINLYDIQTNTTHKLTAHDGDVQKIAFLPNSKQLISSSEDGTIIVWDVSTQKIAKRLKTKADIFTITPDGTTLVINNQKQIALIDLTTNTQQTLTTHANAEESFVTNMVFNTDGTLLATQKLSDENKKPKIQIWDMQTGMLKTTIQVPMDYTDHYFFIPNTPFLVIIGEKTVLFWNIHTNQLVIKYDIRCWSHGVNMIPNGSGVIVSGTVGSEEDENEVQETNIFLIGQGLLQALKNLSFEQILIIAHALHSEHAGTPLDLSNSPQLLEIFNQIDPTYRDIFKKCFMIKTE